MKTCLIAAVCFAIPIIGVVAMNPAAAKQGLQDAKEWAEKSFPTPEPKKDLPCRRS